MSNTSPSDEMILAQMQRWIERAVIGLNLCPFARAVHQAGRIRWAMSSADNEAQLIADLDRELDLLLTAPATNTETTILILRNMLGDFLDFNQFLGQAEDLLTRRDLEGTVQVASFHPDYRFAGTSPDDIGNFTNRSPYPALHLLRETSIDRAVQLMPDTERIFENNLKTMASLGHRGWRRLWD